MGHLQLEMPLQTDNSTSEVIVIRTIVQKLSKAMEMNLYWLYNQENQKHFQVSWVSSLQNLGDYHTKHHQAAHHHAIRDIYLHRKTTILQDRGIK